MKKYLAWLGVMVLVMGCETTRPVVRYPGLTADPSEATCVLREADHCFIGSVDNLPIEQYDVNILSPGIYRQYRVPAGEHVLTIFFRENRNFELISGGPRRVDIKVQGDRCYVLKASLNAMDVAFGDSLSNVSWRPRIVDSKNGTCAGEATLTAQ